jgi:hypothetical protein
MSTTKNPCSSKKTLNISNIKESIKIFDEIVEQYDKPLKTDPIFEIFNSTKPPRISIHDFIDRIIKYCKIDVATFVTMMIYIDKAREVVQFTNFNIHKIILGSMICSIKYCNDEIYPNTFYARVGGIDLEEMNVIEITFCALLGFDFYVNHEIYFQYESYCIDE